MGELSHKIPVFYRRNGSKVTLMNTRFRLCLLFVLVVLQTQLHAQEELLKRLEDLSPPTWKASTPIGLKLETIGADLSGVWELVPKVPIEEQNLYMQKGLPAVFHYGDMIAVARMRVEDLLTMEEMFVLIPEGEQKKRLGKRMADAYRGTRDSLMLPHFVGVDFEHAGRLKESDALREAVEKMRHIYDAFQVIWVERTSQLTTDDRQMLEKMVEEVKRTYDNARKGQLPKE